MEECYEWLEKNMANAKKAEPVLKSVRSILLNPPFIKYLPEKQKEIDKLKFIDYLYKWDTPPIKISVHYANVEWIVENVLYPLRLRYGCFYDLTINNTWKELVYTTKIRGIPIRIHLCYATDCVWEKTNKPQSYNLDTYKMVCNGELA